MACTWSFICIRPYFILYNDKKVVPEEVLTSEEMEYTLWMSELLNGSTLTALEGVHPNHILPHWIMEIIVLLSLSVRPYDVGWYGIMQVFAISTISQMALNVLLSKE